MSLICVDVRSRKPISSQLVDCIKDLILQGLIKPDEQLPSVRALSGELTINPNTIQNAYAELERGGIIYSIPGRGNFACRDISVIADAQKEKLLEEIQGFVKKTRIAGFSRQELLDAIGKEWDSQS
jgi:GntR family transcriptional regulator